MAFLAEQYKLIKSKLSTSDATLVAVSKTKPATDILEAYHNGVLDFGENYVQELVEKHEALPKDIKWHFIGHLQTNKVKYIAPFVHLIHSVDSEKLLLEINKQGKKTGRIINCLLQIYIAEEETKFGLDKNELGELIKKYFSGNTATPLENVKICGLMGMASFIDSEDQVKKEFKSLKDLFTKYQSINLPNFDFQILSMGMSGDFDIAVER